MPFGYGGHCYETTAEALEAFQVTFPLFGDAQWQWHNSSTISGGGLITYSVTQKPSTTNTTTVRSGTIQLTACTTPDVAKFDPAAAGGVFAFFFLGVAGTWYLAQNLGLILSAVRRF